MDNKQYMYYQTEMGKQLYVCTHKAAKPQQDSQSISGVVVCTLSEWWASFALFILKATAKTNAPCLVCIQLTHKTQYIHIYQQL